MSSTNINKINNISPEFLRDIFRSSEEKREKAFILKKEKKKLVGKHSGETKETVDTFFTPKIAKNATMSPENYLDTFKIEVPWEKSSFIQKKLGPLRKILRRTKKPNGNVNSI